MELNEHAVAVAVIAYGNAMLGQVPNTGNMIYGMRKAIEAYVDAARQPAPPARCQARQQSDEMQCGRCGLTWDVNDQDRPPCSPTERRIAPRRADEALELFEADGLAGEWKAPA